MEDLKLNPAQSDTIQDTTATPTPTIADNTPSTETIQPDNTVVNEIPEHVEDHPTTNEPINEPEVLAPTPNILNTHKQEEAPAPVMPVKKEVPVTTGKGRGSKAVSGAAAAKEDGRKICSIALSKEEFEYLQKILEARQEAKLSVNMHNMFRQMLNFAANYEEGWTFGRPDIPSVYIK